ncbi:Aste57867_22492 [Aphanomyces stellatus]|uniref:Aste57867_22492 protein n=1 Tax=Aphanomyces stellatus TaxID=120398 RepID=A0A485LLW7_9STRA|nr:hypothetical protein As57867_022422 [Aphanomyces stellatus]VFT99152.1 Aste57867_22492 [Aphanomyces stellatus]
MESAVERRRPSLTTTSSGTDCITCRTCKRQIPLDEIGDHECTPSTSAKDKLLPTLPSPASPAAIFKPLLKPPAIASSSPPPLLTRKSSLSSNNQTADIQARVDKVAVTKLGFAKYVISSSLWQNGPQFTVERRYQEFFDFATMLYAIYPSKDLWTKLPPKTYCTRSRNLSDGFLLRRKVGLEGFLCAAIDLLLNPNAAGPTCKRTLTQMHVLREFLGIPAARDVQGAIRDLKRIGGAGAGASGWKEILAITPTDRLFEQRLDGFNTIKRVATLPFPARAILDALVLPPSQAAKFNPLVACGDVIRKDSISLWVEHVKLKALWLLPPAEFVNVRSWRLEPNGTIFLVTVPAAAQDIPPHVKATAQAVLQGYILVPNQDDKGQSTTVTSITQMDFGGIVGANSTWNKLALMNIASELGHVARHLHATFDKEYYESVGPLVSADELQSVSLQTKDMVGSKLDRDPKVFLLCQQIEPLFCLLVHKNTNRNALILKLNVTLDADSQELNMKEPLVGEWVMFEKAKNPRQSMSAIERNTTYQWSSKHLGQGVFSVQFGMLKGRSFQLRNHAGYFLHGTLNGKPNVMLKRFYLTFAPSMVGLGQLEKIELVGETESEVVHLRS